MNNKKGFTLVELLAVIIILSIVLVIALPIIVNRINTSEQKLYEKQAQLIVEAARGYVLLNEADINWIGTYTVIYLEELQDAGVIANPLEDPRGGYFNNSKPGGYKVVIRNVGSADMLCDLLLPGEEVGDISGANVPHLVNGMIPVMHNGTNWIKADEVNRKGSYQWYNYDEQIWANAVTVTSTNRTTYMNADVGTVIPMTDINTMFVWIPRYKYKIPAGADAREIDVVFENRDIKKSIGDAVTTYYTHPAFTFGTDELEGIWIGKFETTGTITSPTIKPDTSAIRWETAKAMFDSVKTKMQANTTTYGFSNDNDIHMIKSTEWGAIAYLSHSKYGKYGNPSYVGPDKEIYLNNSSGHYAGRSMGTYGDNGIKTPTYQHISAGYYTYDGKCATIHANLPAPCNSGSTGQVLTDKTLAYGASTTGTIYGIYDTVGGSSEYVMGNYNKILSASEFDDAFFNNVDNNKYYDLYTTTTPSTACNGKICYGHALSETLNWYNDYHSFLWDGSPWLMRSSTYSSGKDAGIFDFHYGTTGSNNANSFRIALSPRG